jgi:hypothetical protein
VVNIEVPTPPNIERTKWKNPVAGGHLCSGISFKQRAKRGTIKNVIPAPKKKRVRAISPKLI